MHSGFKSRPLYNKESIMDTGCIVSLVLAITAMVAAGMSTYYADKARKQAKKALEHSFLYREGE